MEISRGLHAFVSFVSSRGKWKDGVKELDRERKRQN